MSPFVALAALATALLFPLAFGLGFWLQRREMLRKEAAENADAGSRDRPSAEKK